MFKENIQIVQPLTLDQRLMDMQTHPKISGVLCNIWYSATIPLTRVSKSFNGDKYNSSTPVVSKGPMRRNSMFLDQMVVKP